MKKEKRKLYCFALCSFGAFALWTVLLRFVDVEVAGPRDTVVGFAALNKFFHRLTGVHMTLYTVTDWLGLVPVTVGIGFAVLGLIQWIKRKNVLQVNRSILVLGGFYLVVLGAYLFFEEFVINYRPVLIKGYLEASYPSSTTLLVLCVMPTAMLQFCARIRNSVLRYCIKAAIGVFILFMVIGRLVSGVHWVTDIIGGILLSASLVMLYASLSGLEKSSV